MRSAFASAVLYFTIPPFEDGKVTTEARRLRRGSLSQEHAQSIALAGVTQTLQFIERCKKKIGRPSTVSPPKHYASRVFLTPPYLREKPA
jgi:hypothetical protein